VSLRSACAQVLLLALGVLWPTPSPATGGVIQRTSTKQAPTLGTSKIPIFRINDLQGSGTSLQISPPTHGGTSLRVGPGTTSKPRSLTPSAGDIAVIEGFLGKKVGPTKFILSSRHIIQEGKGYLVFDKCYIDGKDEFVGFCSPPESGIPSYIYPMITLNLTLPKGQYVITCGFSGSSSVEIHLSGGPAYTFPNPTEPVAFLFESNGETTGSFSIFSRSAQATPSMLDELFWQCEVKPML